MRPIFTSGAGCHQAPGVQLLGQLLQLALMHMRHLSLLLQLLLQILQLAHALKGHCCCNT